MVSPKMRKHGRLVQKLDPKVYRDIGGKVSKNLPKHVGIEIERKREERKIEVWSLYPKIVEDAIKKALDEV